MLTLIGIFNHSVLAAATALSGEDKPVRYLHMAANRSCSLLAGGGGSLDVIDVRTGLRVLHKTFGGNTVQAVEFLDGHTVGLVAGPTRFLISVPSGVVRHKPVIQQGICIAIRRSGL